MGAGRCPCPGPPQMTVGRRKRVYDGAPRDKCRETRDEPIVPGVHFVHSATRLPRSVNGQIPITNRCFGGFRPVRFRALMHGTRRSVQGRDWPEADQPLWSAQRQQADVRSWGLLTTAVDLLRTYSMDAKRQIPSAGLPARRRSPLNALIPIVPLVTIVVRLLFPVTLPARSALLAPSDRDVAGMLRQTSRQRSIGVSR